jgi:hypothetical protein
MFAQLLLAAISGAIETELVALLEKFKELNGQEKYDELRLSLTNGFTLLKSVTDKTKTKIDDTVVKMILDALNAAA